MVCAGNDNLLTSLLLYKATGLHATVNKMLQPTFLSCIAFFCSLDVGLHTLAGLFILCLYSWSQAQFPVVVLGPLVCTKTGSRPQAAYSVTIFKINHSSHSQRSAPFSMFCNVILHFFGLSVDLVPSGYHCQDTAVVSVWNTAWNLYLAPVNVLKYVLWVKCFF